jgi:hypothetical protein
MARAALEPVATSRPGEPAGVLDSHSLKMGNRGRHRSLADYVVAVLWRSSHWWADDYETCLMLLAIRDMIECLLLLAYARGGVGPRPHR